MTQTSDTVISGVETRRCSLPLQEERLDRAKVAFTLRRMKLQDAAALVTGKVTPRPGDLVLAKVECIGQHTGLQLAQGRRATLFVGDEIVVAYAARYAPDQFEAVVPDDLGSCHLVAAGGVAARVMFRHDRMKRPTKIKPIGILADARGRRMNLNQGALPPVLAPRQTLVVACVGTAMNAGKTTSAAYLVNGLVKCGFSVGAAKVTGTGAPGDICLVRDAGAEPVFDFTDVGYASTFQVSASEVENITGQLVAHLDAADIDIAVVEVADGLFQSETAELLVSRTFRDSVDGIVFCAGDAMGARAGVQWLREHGLPVVGVSGLLTASPLAVREVQNVAGDVPVLSRNAMSDPASVSALVEQLLENRSTVRSVEAA